jgi:drug/metabolite transporter (DMT)-like permease
LGQALWLVAFGVLQMGLPYVLFARGVRHIPGHQASFIVLLEPILVPFWVWLAWRHDPSYAAPSWWTFVGGLMILLGLATRFGLGVRESK